MKKNIVKVFSLVLVAIMLVACTSCTQTILVRFVDAQGNDLNLGGVVAVDTTAAPATDATTAAPASDATTAAPASEATTAAPASDATTAAPASEATTAAPASDATTAAPASAVPADKNAIADFYKAAAAKVKNDGAAGYVKKEWQTIGEININSVVNGAVKSLVAGFMTTEADAKDQVSAKGSDDAKSRFPGFTLTDYSKIASATCTVNANGNYDITMIMVDEDTPTKNGSVLGQVTNSLMYWEDVEKELTSNSTVTAILKSYSGVHVNYKGYKITAEITPDGKFVSITHIGNVDIVIGEAKIIAVTVKDKSAQLVNYCTYKNFEY